VAEDPLVRIARARHQAEAELIEGLLRDQGIPSLTRRAPGFDVPDFLAAGPRDVLVPARAADLAREILRETVTLEELDGAAAAARAPVREPVPAWVRAMAVVLAVALVAFVLVGAVIALAT
jgi:hypothetical protein